MLLLSALLMPCTPFRIGPTRIERELAELEQAAERAGLDGVRLPFELDLVPAMFQHLLSTGALNRRHVLYQSVDRFCAEALGLESSYAARAGRALQNKNFGSRSGIRAAGPL